MYHTLHGRKVYGEGGIMPDIFVPLDTAELTSYYIHLENKSIFYQFAFEYSDANRSKLNEFTSSEDMLNYLKTQPLLYNIIQYAEARGIKRRSSLIGISADQILNTTYAGILQNFFGEEAYFAVILNNDKMVKRAILEIQKGNALQVAVANSTYQSN